MFSTRLFALAAAGLIATGTVPITAAEFIPLGKLRASDQFSEPYAVSADGNTVVGIVLTTSGYEAVRWTFPTGIQSLGASPVSTANATTANGEYIVGGRVTESGGEPYRWSSAGGFQGLGDLPGGLVGGEATGVSSDGLVVVGSSSSGLGGEAFRWTVETGLVGLGLSPEGFRTMATGVSADGLVIVGNGRTVAPPGLGEQAFRWTAETGQVPLGDLPGGIFYSEAFGVSADGSVVVGKSAADFLDYTAFRWTAETGMVAIPVTETGGRTRWAEAVSGDGNVIVGIADSRFSTVAFAWDQFHGTRRLPELLESQGVDLTGWQLEIARGVSYDGSVIVGNGTNPSGEREAWLARFDAGTFIPEPSALVLAAAAAVLVLITGFLKKTMRAKSALARAD
jgi:probable HAF family extracellular repeat protein